MLVHSPSLGAAVANLQRYIAAHQQGAELTIERESGTTPAREWLAETLASTKPTAEPAQLAPYSPDAYRDRLLSLYSDLTSTTPAPPAELPRENVLSQFLHPAAFHFLRT